jgi:hypothetical protein
MSSGPTEGGTGDVFISYSQFSVEHMEWVLNLSNRLRSEGVDCDIDQYQVSPPEGWPRWMDLKIQNAKYVVLVCTEAYFNRVMGREKEGAGLGVRWEGNLVYQHLYNAGALNTKFVPIIVAEQDKRFIPTPLQGATYYNLANESGYEGLYRRLTDQPKSSKPKLGKLRSLPPKSLNPALYLNWPIDVDLWNAAEWKATAVIIAPVGPPMLGIAFSNEAPARNIFEKWRKRYGENDAFEELRVSIIEGTVSGESGYSVHIGSDPDAVIKRLKDAGYDPTEGLHFFVSRINRMNPAPDSKNLAVFKERFKQSKNYILLPAIISPDKMSMRPLFELGIHKTKIHFRTASEIGVNDIDSVIFKLPTD